ncbi:MAG: DUF2283 domain-containing protein [Euryarchaeota archaeon]|nr:DUF2283 domain-containing protein [Euryarchaeota archaeon]MBU4491752.1 DUF2283 domain-containing protein [Euryarchaeota archaeon]MCG2727049.1 DUF2283 domain-containing protein [Candidatus Methanoperedenaceae archaeon]
MVKDAKIDFDYENDILYLYTGEKVRDSLQIEDFIIDFSHDNTIVAIEILDASKILSELSQADVTKDALSKIESARMSVYRGKELIYVLLAIRLSINQESMDIRIPVPAPAAVSAVA